MSMAMIEHTVKTMYGQLELQLLELDDDAIEEEDIMGWADAHWHRLARAFYVHTTHGEIRGEYP